MAKTEVICICCPKGCHLTVDPENDYKVTGAGCKNGVAYGKEELVNPTRIVTSTVKVAGGTAARLPVKTQDAVPKGSIFDVMRALDAVEVTPPVSMGDVIVADVCGTGANVVATRSLGAA